jgi:hypothetical protein
MGVSDSRIGRQRKGRINGIVIRLIVIYGRRRNIDDIRLRVDLE